MSSQVSSVQGLFKKVYGDLKDLVPGGFVLQEELKFDQRKRVGESYVECVVLGAECGITYGGSSAEVVSINAAAAGAVKQAVVKDYQTILASVIPFQTLSRSAEQGQQAFIAASKHVVKNNLKSHHAFIEAALLYGQSDAGLGYVSYATATYRGVAFTNGGATLDSIVFTAGVNTTTREILLAPGSFASGLWTGMEGVTVKQVATSSGAVVGEGQLQYVSSEYGYIRVSFTPTAATSTTSHKLVFSGWESSLEMIGMFKIMQNTGTLMEISAATYPLWKGTSYNAYQPGGTTPGRLTFAKVTEAVGQAVNRAGLDSDVLCIVNPRSWTTLLTEQAALRSYDQSYSPASVEQGSKSIKFYGQAGYVEIKPSRHMKEGHALILDKDNWSRFGSAEVSFKIPGMDQELIVPLENQTGYAFRSFGSQCVLCSAPARSVLISNINDESTT